MQVTGLYRDLAEVREKAARLEEEKRELVRQLADKERVEAELESYRSRYAALESLHSNTRSVKTQPPSIYLKSNVKRTALNHYVSQRSVL